MTTYPGSTSVNSGKQVTTYFETQNTGESFINPSTKKSEAVTMEDIKIGDEENQNMLILEFQSDLVIQLKTSENEEN